MPVMYRRPARARRALLLPVLAACVALAAVPAVAGPRDRLDRLDEARRRVNAQLERVHASSGKLGAKIAALDRERAVVETRIHTLNRKLRGLDAAISAVRKRLMTKQLSLDLLGERLTAIESRLAEREDLFHERAVSAYMAGPAAGIETLLSSQDLSELLDRAAYYESALSADSALLGEIDSLEDQVTTKHEQLEASKDRIAADESALQEQRTRLALIRDRRADALAARQAAIATKKALFANLRSRADRLAGIERQLARESDSIEALLARRAAGSAPVAADVGRLAWPASGPVTSGFGYRVHPIFGDRRMHTGIDIGAPYGAPVWAADAGTVVYAGTLSGYGNAVVVDHGGGLATTYNHLSAFEVTSGQRVARGEHIGAVGCSGYCTGPHLHFEVRVNGTPVDPMPYLR
jgi:murein DD-endopeptidase MepM/ murein hydrolase activator NlpD